MQNIQIQIQDISGRWFTIQSTSPSDQAVQLALDSAFKLYKKKVRAIDSHGAIINARFA